LTHEKQQLKHWSTQQIKINKRKKIREKNVIVPLGLGFFVEGLG
jgi:hypothetical protein